jgi:hypothetical protein
LNACIESTGQTVFLETDASKKGIGGVFYQVDERKKISPLAFYSHALKPTEKKNYVTIELEALAILYCQKEGSCLHNT